MIGCDQHLSTLRDERSQPLLLGQGRVEARCCMDVKVRGNPTRCLEDTPGCGDLEGSLLPGSNRQGRLREGEFGPSGRIDPIATRSELDVGRIVVGAGSVDITGSPAVGLGPAAEGRPAEVVAKGGIGGVAEAAKDETHRRAPGKRDPSEGGQRDRTQIEARRRILQVDLPTDPSTPTSEDLEPVRTSGNHQ